MSADLDAVEKAEPSLLQRIASTTCVCAIAAGLFILVSGMHEGGPPKDARLTVAQCWHDIEEQQPTGDALHDMRVNCQELESSLMASSHGRTEVVATQD